MGEFAKAHEHLQRALTLFDRKRHHDFMHLFGQDVGSQGGIFDALALYALGHVDEALHRADRAGKDAGTTAHVPTLTQFHYWRFFLGLTRKRPDWVLTDVNSFSKLASEHHFLSFVGYSKFAQGWLNWSGGNRDTGIGEMSEGIARSREQGLLLGLPLFEAVLAKAEADTGKIDSALTRLDKEFAEIAGTGERSCEAELRRVRGEILLKHDPANTAPAEEAFLTAIAIAQQQKAKSFELQAALRLAKLYQSTNRAADAHAVLAPALEGFSPTPEFPEIEEAQRLLGSLGS
jgi:tetratricopeptide (TPR) repeat protein